MSVTMQPSALTNSAELVGLVDQAARLAELAGRADLTERLTQSRGRLAARRMRVVVVGAPGQGATALTHVLEQAAGERVPGASFSDAPGRAAAGQMWVLEPGAADAVLFVSDADQEYNAWELEAIARIRAQGTALAGILTKIDTQPRWGEVQRANRQRLQAENLDSPSVPLLPVSAALLQAGQQRGDDSLIAASGVPQLLDFLRDRVGTRVELRLRDAVLADVRAVSDQLARDWNTELDGLNAHAGGSPLDRQSRAVAELDRRQQLSASWQVALGDGTTELVSQVDFDLRERLREVLEQAEEDIENRDPVRNWTRFDSSLRESVEEATRANFALAGQRSERLAEQVAAKLAGNPDGSTAGVKLPSVWLQNPDDAMSRITPMRAPENGGMFARVVNSLRGSYGGVLMVGLLTGLAGLQLISVYSVSAGLLLGVFTFWEDRKNGRERAKAEAKMAVAKLMDNVNFRVGDELRTQLRTVHRTLRDHFTGINDQRLRTAADAVRAAVDAAARGERPDARLAELQNNLAELRQLRVHTTVSAR